MGIMPKSPLEEVVDSCGMVSMGGTSDKDELVYQAYRLGIVDILILIMCKAIQDIMFDSPEIFTSRIGFDLLRENTVNIALQGHIPLLAEKLIYWCKDKEFIQKAENLGARKINLVGLCGTGSEMLLRYGVPVIGGNLQQELCISTGLLDAFVVDGQCAFPGVIETGRVFHTKIITTMKDGKLPLAIYIPFADDNADGVAKQILDIAISNFNDRKEKRFLPKCQGRDFITGFSVKNCLEILAGMDRRDPLGVLARSIKEGKIYGIVLLNGCTNPKVTVDASYVTIAKELLKRNVLIFATGCASFACAREGLLHPEATEKYAETGLKEILKELGVTSSINRTLPPVWHVGSCLDASSVGLFFMQLAERMNVDLKDLPICVSASEWVTEKIISTCFGLVALGLTVHLGITPPFLGSAPVISILTERARESFGSRFIIEPEPLKARTLIYDHLSEKRKGLGFGR
jgi:carbon-monoxide dehydrogenase catalytic subunit